MSGMRKKINYKNVINFKSLVFWYIYLPFNPPIGPNGGRWCLKRTDNNTNEDYVKTFNKIPSQKFSYILQEISVIL